MKNSHLLFSILLSFFAFNFTQADDRVPSTVIDSTENNQPSTGTYIDDATITAKIKSAFLADKDIKSISISVKTNYGVVILNGEVNSALEKNKAIDIAKQIDGVKDVIDQIKIKSTQMK